MPELPEVESIKCSLQKYLNLPVQIKSIDVYQNQLREKINAQEIKLLKGQKIISLHRRAKYLLWKTDSFVIISHLGMTGHWRPLSSSPLLPHDHLVMRFTDGRGLVYNDPRRFGLFRTLVLNQWEASSYLRNLGPEPLSLRDFHAVYLYHLAQRRKVAIKNFLMNQKIVVGIGNIYASEVLFQAQIKPQRSVARIKQREFELLVKEIRRVLKSAIKWGGTTIKDFRLLDGKEGSFVRHLAVYDREGQPCRRCSALIKQTTLGGRSTYWCPQCQK